MKRSPPRLPTINVRRTEMRLFPDQSRVVLRPMRFGSDEEYLRIIRRTLALPEADVRRTLDHVLAEFSSRHRRLTERFLERFCRLEHFLPPGGGLSEARKLLIGSYFLFEYSAESAALFNPSILPHPDQSGLPKGSLRFLLSLRSTGEGHISSIVFRRGVITKDHRIIIEADPQLRRPLKIMENRTYQKEEYSLKLKEMEGANPLADIVLDRLGAKFTSEELSHAINAMAEPLNGDAAVQETAEDMLSLARANYEIILPKSVNISAAVIFPHSENESRGLEDLRLVRFKEDDETHVLYGTYTAYNGFHILPPLLEARQGSNIAVHTLAGSFAKNKGMALFPRKVGGQYMMSGRIDNENLFIMKSDSVMVWNHAQMVQTPRFPWELMQLGNCGSPIETKEGWLLLTHGVGPMRQYCVGAVLLDLDDPTKVIRQTREPLMMPQGKERSGYVPNVVYSCGAMIHNEVLVIPYAMSDTSSGFATIPSEAIFQA